MDRVHPIFERDAATSGYVAVGVKSVGADAGQRHVGIFYHDSDAAGARLLHLAWHCELRSDAEWSQHWLWVDPPLPDARARNVAAKCRQIWRANQAGRIPYGFSPPSACFDPQTFEYLVGPSRHGLTCATFVLAVFGQAGITLAEIETWPTNREGDVEWQRRVVAALTAGGAHQQHVDAVQNDIGVVRIRPEEVAAAAARTPPSAFADVEPLARAILAMLPN